MVPKRRAMEKRMNGLVADLSDKIQELCAEAQDEREVARLHDLRKRCREMTYIIEYGEPNQEVRLAEQVLEGARSEIGAIRDDDLLLDFLRDVRTPRQLVAEVSRARHTKYQRFVSGQLEVRDGRSKLVASIVGFAGGMRPKSRLAEQA
jgi:CHAD domain-containing protein